MKLRLINIVLGIALVFPLSSCKINDGGENRSVEERINISAYNISRSIIEQGLSDFTSLYAVAEYEALPDDEKNKPIYNCYRKGRLETEKGVYYPIIGEVYNNGLRLNEVGAMWATSTNMFKCTALNRLEWEPYYGDEDKVLVSKSVMVLDGDTVVALHADIRENGKYGYTLIYTKEPIIYNFVTDYIDGILYLDFYDKKDKLLNSAQVKYSVKGPTFHLI